MALTPDETESLVELLEKMERPYPEELFLALCANVIMCPVEIIPLTREGKVLLLRRPSTDPWFSNLWHTPGSLQLKGDTITSTQQRIIENELQGLDCSALEFFGYEDVMRGSGEAENPRGQERPLIFVAWVKEESYQGDGRFFPIAELPDDTLSMHKNGFLPKIRARYFS